MHYNSCVIKYPNTIFNNPYINQEYNKETFNFSLA
jgi:hypothetical protein